MTVQLIQRDWQSFMDDFQPQVLYHQFLLPAALAILIYGLRYAVMASAAFLMASRGWGRPHINAPVAFDRQRHVRRELVHSALTVFVFGGVNALLFGFGFIHQSLVYYHAASYPLWWFWLSIPVMLMLHDTLFYWIHRAMHHRALFAAVHRVHHQSVHPTAFTAYSFHPNEAVVEALIVTAIVFIIPVHPIAFLIFQTISTAYNVYGHCGREFYPPGTALHWFGRWLNTSTAHAVHHGQGHFNYGLYFMFWDRWMKTTDPGYR